MIYLAGTIIAFFLSFILLSKKNKNTADKILFVWLLVMGLHLFFFYLSISGLLYQNTWILGTHFPLPLLHGPFLYLYTAALTGRIQKFRASHLVHFLPAFAEYMYLSHFFLLPGEEKIAVFKNGGKDYLHFLTLNSILINVSGLVYVLLTFLRLRKHRLNLLREFSYTERINLRWMQYLLFGIGFIWLFVLIDNDQLIFTSAVLFVFFIGYFGIKQVGIFTLSKPIEESTDENYLREEKTGIGVSAEKSAEVSEPEEGPESFLSSEQEDEKKKYIKSGLSAEASDALHKKLCALMENEKTFNQSELVLAQLAKKLGTHPNYLSQVINEKENKNFFDYINTLRVEEFKKRLSDPGNRKFTLLSLALDCGFNSKSTFNKYFRKVSGLSPTEYLDQLNKNK